MILQDDEIWLDIYVKLTNARGMERLDDPHEL